MPAKRTASTTQTKAPAAKKAKTSPLEKKFQTVLSALTDVEAVVPCREMLVEIAESALKLPQSERHENQVAVLDMMRKVFEDEKLRWTARIAEAQSIHDVAAQERTEKMAVKDAADTNVKEQKDLLTEKRDNFDKAEETLKECEEELATAQKEQGSTREAQQTIIEEQTKVLGVQESLKVLKEGTCDVPKDVKKHLAAITSLFKTLEVEEALIKTLPQVLGRKPEERGSFDELSLKQMEEYITNQLTALSSKIEAAGVHVSDGDIAATAWEAAVEVAQDKLGECKAAVEVEEAKLEELQAALTAARKILKEQGAIMKKKGDTLFTEQYGLDKTEDVLSALEFLSVYEVPEPVPEVVMEEPVPEVVMEDLAELETKAEEVTELELKAKELPSENVFSCMPSPTKRRSGEFHLEAMTVEVGF